MQMPVAVGFSQEPLSALSEDDASLAEVCGELLAGESDGLCHLCHGHGGARLQGGVVVVHLWGCRFQFLFLMADGDLVVLDGRLLLNKAPFLLNKLPFLLNKLPFLLLDGFLLLGGEEECFTECGGHLLLDFLLLGCLVEDLAIDFKDGSDFSGNEVFEAGEGEVIDYFVFSCKSSSICPLRILEER